MQYFQRDTESGFTLVDLVLSIGIITVLFGGIYLVYFSILDTVINYELRRAAAAVMAEQVELVRNIPFEDIGTIGGIPAGILEQIRVVQYDNIPFVLKTTARNVDDPFDGTVNGSPADTAPADYKLLDFEVSCPSCARFTPVSITTTVAPAGLESASKNGSIFINVFDAEGVGVPTAAVRIVNTSVSPTIDFTDVTNASGTLQLIDVPTSTQAYEITITKDDYSSDQTYTPGEVENPNPINPHATVTEQTVTILSFAIDQLSDLVVATSDNRCNAIPDQSFDLVGSKLIGAGPDIIKYSTSTTTDGDGLITLSDLEWDTYAFTYTEGDYDVIGSIPHNPLVVQPGVTTNYRLVLGDISNPSLVTTIQDGGTGLPVTTASIVLDGATFDATKLASHSIYTETDWSGGSGYSNESGGITVNSPTGQVRLATLGGSYPTSTVHWLESNTFDAGGTPGGISLLEWSPTSQPAGVGSDAIRFRIAASDTDGPTWNFLGSDGTGSSYYSGNPSSLHSSVVGKRYVRYRIYLQTADQNVTPRIEDLSLEFTGPCVPPGERLFESLPTGNYDFTVSNTGYENATGTINVTSGFKESIIELFTP